MDEKGKLTLTIAFGVLGVIAPAASIFVAKFMEGSGTQIASFNSMTIMILSVLVIIFLVISSFSNFNTNNKKSFLIGILFLLASLISFIYNLLVFINL